MEKEHVWLKKIIIAAAVTFVAVLVLMGGLNQSGAEVIVDPSCQNCHGSAVQDFNGSGVNRPAVCSWCHKSGHYAPKQYVNGTFIGYFTTPGAIDADAKTIHAKHAGYNRYSNTKGCLGCHKPIGCDVCHTAVKHGQHGSTKYTGPTVTEGLKTAIRTGPSGCYLSQCHQGFAAKRVNDDNTQLCINCHTTDKSGHTNAAGLHKTSFVANPSMACSACHKNDLVTEHASRKNDANEPYDCLTCHKNDRPDIQAAITGNNTNCDACHTGFDHASVHRSATIDDKCGTCHNGNLVDEHLSNPITQKTTLNCDTCHESDKFDVLAAIKIINTTDCTACHATAHNVNLVLPVPSDIPLYEGFIWSLPQDAAFWAGEGWFNPVEMENAKRVLTNRRSDVTAQQVKDFYLREMPLRGWDLASQEYINTTTVLKFSKGERYATVMFYDSEIPKGAAEVPGSYRLDILYQ